jgi:NAD(P)-dependent dehydrogenase (short-subunit alcohol dehydrogenase family)
VATPDFIKAPIALINNLILAHPKAKQVDLSGKTILVTGTTPGSIGFECAKTLLQWGATVCITARNERNVQRCIDSLKIELSAFDRVSIDRVPIDKTSIDERLKGFELDLGNSISVSSFTTWFKAEYTSLDVLINNAGIYLDVLGQWSESKLSEDGKELHWRVNYLGSVQLTCELLPILNSTAKVKGEARIVNVSSHMHDNCLNQEMFTGLQPYKSVKAYGRSKLALNHFTFYLHEKLFKAHAVKAICLHPGSIYTNLVDKGLEGNPRLLAVRSKLSWIEKLILLSPQEGTQTQLLCASDPDVSSGSYYQRCVPAQIADTLYEQGVSEKLWQETKTWLKEVSPQLDLSLLDAG